jgi:hypothetical protein
MARVDRHESLLLVEDFPGAARQIVAAIGREYDIVHTGAFDVAQKLIAHIAFDHYIFDIDFPDTYAEWLQFIHETIELRVDPSFIANKYYNYGNGLRLFDVLRQVWGDQVHVLFQSGSAWSSYEDAVDRLKSQCPHISFLNKSPFLRDPLRFFRLSLPNGSPRSPQ